MEDSKDGKDCKVNVSVDNSGLGCFSFFIACSVLSMLVMIYVRLGTISHILMDFHSERPPVMKARD